jgi:hypothetical protein
MLVNPAVDTVGMEFIGIGYSGFVLNSNDVVTSTLAPYFSA